MLWRLTISNYALIDELAVNFEPGLNIITGETGAGKSIVLGALSLILGARADSSTIRNKEKKCVVEGAFKIHGLGLEPFFTENDLDYDNSTIIRREITTAGKSRAFINDTPVNLQQIRELTLRLIDIHSQHQNLELNNHHFQLQLVDVVADSQEKLENFRLQFAENQELKNRLKLLQDQASKAAAELDYFQFQHNQLAEANLTDGEQEELEEERRKLAHAEEIKSALSFVNEQLEEDNYSVLQKIRESLNRLVKIREYMKEAGEAYQRLESVYIELQDLAHECGLLAEDVEFNPQRLEQIAGRLDVIFTLQQKHQVSTVAQLIELREGLAKKINSVADFEQEIASVQKKLTENNRELNDAAAKLTAKRRSVFSKVESEVVSVLRQLGMHNAIFKVEHQIRENFTITGADQVQFLFSANKNTPVDEISKIASGGEISRVMLALKTLVSGSRMLPTVIFDEIDAGISGEMALKMGAILKKLSAGMQIINITHLPQVAGRGDHHYKVFKFDEKETTVTAIKKLTHDERVEELASMVGGANPSETARKTARELMQNF